MNMVKSIKKKIVTFMTCLMTCMVLLGGAGLVSPTVAYGAPTTPPATTGSDISDTTITINENGEMTIGGNKELTSAASGTKGSSWNEFIGRYKNFIVGIAGVGTISMIFFFVVMFVKLGSTAGNPQERQKTITGLIWTGIAAAGLGSVTTFVGFAYGAFR